MSIPGLIADMDMMLSINESTINAQLLNLYDCPNPLDSDDYLISHNIKMGYELVETYDPDTGEPAGMVPSQEGLTASIDSPTVNFNDYDKNSKFKSFRINFPIIDGALSYFNGAQIARIDLKNYVMSWCVNIGRRDIRNIEETAMHPDAREQLTAFVRSSDFLVSSLFCLFESTQVASSFKITKEDGSPLADKHAMGLLNVVNNAWGNPEFQASNPFVLGYQVSQSIPDPSNPNDIPAFAPYDFILTATPTTTSAIQPTLNFGIMSGARRDLSNDLNAAVLEEPLSVITGSATSKEDGVFGFSRKIFFENWLHPAIIDPFWVEPGTGWDKPYVSTYTDSVEDHGASYSRTKSFETNKLDANYKVVIDDRREWYTGYETLTVTLQSALNATGKQQELPADQDRKLTINVNGKSYLQLNIETKAVGPAGRWASGGYYSAWVTYDAQFTVHTENSGRWAVTTDVMNLPPVVNGNVKVNEDSHIHGWVVFEDFLQNFRDTANHTMNRFLSVKFNQKWEDDLNDAVKTFQTKIVMPAGDVVDFNGLDIDPLGNVYSHVKYKTIASGDKTGFLNGTYYIVNAATGTRWEDVGAMTSNGSLITGNPSANTPSQQWLVTPYVTGSTKRTIQFMGSPRPAYASSIQTTSVAPFPTLQINSNPTAFNITAGTIKDAYCISPVVPDEDPLIGLMVNLEGANAAPGTRIIYYPNTPNAANQQWFFVPV